MNKEVMNVSEGMQLIIDLCIRVPKSSEAASEIAGRRKCQYQEINVLHIY